MDSYNNREHSHYQLAQLVVRVLPIAIRVPLRMGSSFRLLAQLVVGVLSIAIRVPLRMGSSSHGGERKCQVGPGVTVLMNGLPPEGYPEGSRRVWTSHLFFTNF